MLVPRFEGVPRNDVNPYSEEFLEILEQADVIKKRRTWLEIHEQIQVAVRASISPGDRAEYGDPTGLALPRNAEDLWAAAAEPLQCQNVIAHASSVSPPAAAGSGLRPAFLRHVRVLGDHGLQLDLRLIGPSRVRPFSEMLPDDKARDVMAGSFVCQRWD